MMIPNVAQFLQFIQGMGGGNVPGGIGGQAGSGDASAAGLFSQILQSLGVNETPADLTAVAQGAGTGADGATGDNVTPDDVGNLLKGLYNALSQLQAGGVKLGDIKNLQDLSKAYQQLGLQPAEADQRASGVMMAVLLLDGSTSVADVLSNAGGDNGAQALSDQQQKLVDELRRAEEQIDLIAAGIQQAPIQPLSTPTAGLDLASQIRSGGGLKGASGPLLRVLTGLTGGVSPADAASAADDLSAVTQQTAAQDTAATTAAGDTAKAAGLEEILASLANQADATTTDKGLGDELRDIAALAQRLLKDGKGLSSVTKKLTATDTAAAAATPRAAAAQRALTQALNEKRPDTAAQQAIEASADGAVSATVAANAEIDARRLADDTKQPLAADAPQPAPLAGAATNKLAGAALPNSHVPGGAAHTGAAAATPSTFDATTTNPATYVVRPAGDGHVEIVDPQTGQVIDRGDSNAVVAPGQQATVLPQQMQIAAQARVAQQVRVHVGTLARHGGGKVVVALNPPELGRIQVQLRIKGGQVHGSIVVQRPEVAEQLARDLRVLEQAFTDVGLSLGEEGIAVQLENQNSGQDGGQDEGSSNGRSGTQGIRLVGSETGATGTGDEAWLSPDRLVDVQI